MEQQRGPQAECRWLQMRRWTRRTETSQPLFESRCDALCPCPAGVPVCPLVAVHVLAPPASHSSLCHRARIALLFGALWLATAVNGAD